MKKSLLGLISICSLCVLSACGGGGTPPPPPPAATHFSVTPASANTTAGVAFNFTVTALDSSNAIVGGYSGMVKFTSTDGNASLPGNSTLTNGTKSFSGTLESAGNQTITATDTAKASITGASTPIKVSSAVAGSPVPFINQPLNPDAIAPGGAGFTLTVNGTGFVTGSKVMWNGSTRATTVVSDARLTASILLTDIAKFNTASVTVVNPNPGGGTSNAAFFETTRPTSSVAWSGASKLTPGTGPSSVATGDLNGDGNLDLVVANGGSNNISIFLNNGDGTFHTAVNYPAGTNPTSVAVADFNGDGNLDLVVANSGSSNVSVLLGKGDGTFKAAVDYGAGSDPTSVAVGDFDGDSKLDLAVANGIDNNVSILLGDGDGTFQVASNFPASSNCSSVAVGDFNGDGKLDLAVANSGVGNFADGTVSILLGNGNGTFQAAVNYSTGFTSSAVVVGDFNGDGKLDLAVLNPDKSGADSSSVSILLGKGDGTFEPKADSADGSRTSSLAAGDFNNDGRLDLAAADSGNSTISVTLQPGLVSGADAILSTNSLGFATQLLGTTSAAQPVQLTNYGSTTLAIAGIAATTNFGETDDCGTSLAAGASCTISVTFAPSTGGNFAGTLSISDNAPGSPQTASLSGKGTAVKLVPDFISFNCLATCGSQTATLTNEGATALTITSITITSNKPGGNAIGFAQTNNCPASLGPGLSCSIKVSFIGVFNFQYVGGVIVSDNDAASPQVVTLRGFLQ